MRPGRAGARSGGARRSVRERAKRAGSSGVAPPSGQPERLQKMLARSGLASRREAEVWIRNGRLTINGTVATLGARVAPGDQVRLDGRLVRAREAAPARVFLCHRSPGEPLAGPSAGASVDAPAGAGTAHAGRARELRPPLIERLPRRGARRYITVSPMPRVDGGLELVTSDGELALRLQRTVHALSSEFGVRLRGELNETQLQGILAGALDSGAHLAVERCEAAGGEGINRWYTLAARGASGKEVRQLFERQGALVSRVLRTQLGPLSLGRSLGRGQFREITDEELRGLLRPEPDDSARAARSLSAGRRTPDR
jgi:23S rRNA pseudouridine2605 synthase